MPTLYDNFSQVKQYIDQQTAGGSSTDITKDIIPAATDTYTLGNSTYHYSTVYTDNTYFGNNAVICADSHNDSSINIKLNGNSKYYFNSSRFAPNGSSNHNALNLGSATRAWKDTYTYNLYLDGNTDIKTMFPTYAYVYNQIGDIESALSALR